MSERILLSTDHTPKVLLVEDDPSMQMIYAYFLGKLGFQTEQVALGQRALYCVAQGHYHAMILDLGLPDIKGESVIECIRANEKNTAHHLPILVTTAHGDAGILTACQKKGADAAFMKPVSLETFQQAFHRMDLTGGQAR